MSNSITDAGLKHSPRRPFRIPQDNDLALSKPRRSFFIDDLGDSSASANVLDEVAFEQMLTIQRKRTERSGKPFLLMLLDVGQTLPSQRTVAILDELASALASARGKDIAGWYHGRAAIGVIFTEIDFENGSPELIELMDDVNAKVREQLTIGKIDRIALSWQLYPERCDAEASEGNPAFYPDLLERHASRKFALTVKRVLDILGSLFAILVFSPLFAIVAVLIRATSKGPVVFRQKRLGQFGKTFELLKFRSMYVNNDHKIHQDFITRVIKGEHDGKDQHETKPVYKMTRDPRITRVGGFLRRTSIDELPQLFNVLRGDMSLVGPRPPLAYEYKEYALWHRRRVLEIKPGITGLWQVRGRSRISFNDMVRLDLEYARKWSLWLDIRILLQTPKAVLFGEDAF